MSQLNQFLDGISILDLSHYLPGPMASLMLGDMGAQVIKVIPPAGDGLQIVGPKDEEGRPIFYEAVNEGKYELQLDLKRETDRDELRGLATRADVLIEGFRPGTLTRLGVSPEALRNANPKLIVCSISGYGASGPLAAAAAHDANLLAIAGIMARNEDCMFDPPVVDCAAALFAALSIAAALHHRNKNGGIGCTIDIGLADVMMPLQACHVAAFARTGWSPAPRSYYINGGLACYNQYRTRDAKRIILGALEEKFWTAFCRGAQHPEWIARHAESQPQDRLIAEVSEFFGAMTLKACEERFRGIDCCLTPVMDMHEALNQPQLRHRDLVRAQGKTMQSLFPAHIDGKPPKSRTELRQVTADEARRLFGD